MFDLALFEIDFSPQIFVNENFQVETTMFPGDGRIELHNPLSPRRIPQVRENERFIPTNVVSVKSTYFT